MRFWNMQKQAGYNYAKLTPIPNEGIIFGGQMQEEVDKAMKGLTDQFLNFFEDRTGKFKGKPIQIQVKSNVVPIIQPTRRIPLQYIKPKKLRSNI